MTLASSCVEHSYCRSIPKGKLLWDKQKSARDSYSGWLLLPQTQFPNLKRRALLLLLIEKEDVDCSKYHEWKINECLELQFRMNQTRKSMK